MTVYVVILNWNGWQDTIECLESLQHSIKVDFRTVVCDNASSDNSILHLKDWAASHFGADEFLLTSKAQLEQEIVEPNKKLTIIDNQGNWGFAGGNNIGIKYALQDWQCEYIWLLNNDTAVEPDAMHYAVSRMNKDPSIGICGSTLIYFDDRSKLQAMGGATYSPVSGKSAHIGAFLSPDNVNENPAFVEEKMSYVVGAAMMVSRGFIHKVGLMHEDYFLYSEEIDWATRGRSTFKLGYAPKSIVYHKEGASIGTSSSGGSPLSIYYLYRNRMKFTLRFYPKFLPTVFLYALVDVLKFSIKGRWKQVVSALRGLLFLQR